MKSNLLKTLALSAITIVLTLLANRVAETDIFKVVFPETIALEEFDFTDFIFSKRRGGHDKNIVVVNCGNRSRAEIGEMIHTISQQKPKVIALDMLFSCFGDSVECRQHNDSIKNQPLVSAFNEFENIVFGQRLYVDTIEEEYNAVEYSNVPGVNVKYQGFLNLDNEAVNYNTLRKLRSFDPTANVNGKPFTSFAVQIAKLVDTERADKFLQTGQSVINFRGNTGYFKTFDWPTLRDSIRFIDLKNKVVIVGYLGDDLTQLSWADRFFTPLNNKVIGLTMPDMYGPFVHANIVAMILNDDVIFEASTFLEYFITFTICFIHILLLVFVGKKYSTWYDSTSIVLIIVQLIIFSLFRIAIFEFYQFKLNLAMTLGSLTLASIVVSLYHGPVTKYVFRKNFQLTRLKA
jgi:CHASE2 domain-containing sensor protein